MPEIDLVLFDIGGVLGTDGWDRYQRADAVEHFALERDDFEARHQEQIARWEIGEITIDKYLDATVFYCPRSFSHEEFRTFMFAQSRPYPEMISLARAVAKGGACRVMTLNNESPELNNRRIEMFGLVGIFAAFLSSCNLGVRKPDPLIYQRALSIAHVQPWRAIFIDDRMENLPPAQRLGMHTIHSTSVDVVQRQLAEFDLVPSP